LALHLLFFGSSYEEKTLKGHSSSLHLSSSNFFLPVTVDPSRYVSYRFGRGLWLHAYPVLTNNSSIVGCRSLIGASVLVPFMIVALGTVRCSLPSAVCTPWAVFLISVTWVNAIRGLGKEFNLLFSRDAALRVVRIWIRLGVGLGRYRGR